MKATARLRDLVSNGMVVAPGIYDGLSGKLVRMSGFEAAYASGGAIARSTGVPDLNLIDLSENVSRLEQIVDAVDIPIIADLDTGYGNALNAQRAARAFERAGVAGFHIEDQVFPKRCGHYDNKSLVPKAEFVQKLKAVKDALHDPDFVVVARTDAIAVDGFDAAIDRAHAYAEAGADVIFVEAPQTEEQIERVACELRYPKLINMFFGAKTPLVPLERLREFGYSIVIIPSDLQRAAIKAMQRTLEVIRREGNSGSINDELASFKDREAIVATAAYLERDSKYAS